MKVITIILSVILSGIVPAGQTFLRPLQQRDSILVADQLEYGFRLDSVKTGTGLALQDFSQLSNDTLVIVKNWQIDTLAVKGPRKSATKLYTIEGKIVLAPFEEGKYYLPPIAVVRSDGAASDTLVFEPQTMDVKTMPVDTATFVLHDIKGQIRYPVTFAEVLPYVLGGLAAAALIALIVFLVRRYLRKRKSEIEARNEPPYIVALRQLDRYRGESYWVPEKQKSFYSGVTDTLRAYMAARFGFDAMEMTSSEIFSALKGEQSIPSDLFADVQTLFETADFVKFAKHTAPDEENAKALPCAVRFVTTTYQAEVEAEAANSGEEAAGK